MQEYHLSQKWYHIQYDTINCQKFNVEALVNTVNLFYQLSSLFSGQKGYYGKRFMNNKQSIDVMINIQYNYQKLQPRSMLNP